MAHRVSLKEAGKTQPFTEHLGDCRGAGGAEAGFSGRGTAGEIDGPGTAGTGARQGWAASAPQGSEGAGAEYSRAECKGNIRLDI